MRQMSNSNGGRSSKRPPFFRPHLCVFCRSRISPHRRFCSEFAEFTRLLTLQPERKPVHRSFLRCESVLGFHEQMWRAGQVHEFHRSIEVCQPRKPFPVSKCVKKTVGFQADRCPDAVETKTRGEGEPSLKPGPERLVTVYPDVISVCTSIKNVLKIAAIKAVRKQGRSK